MPLTLYRMARMRVRHRGPDFSAEAGLAASGALRIAGVDEAGRGPLAGPVCVAAVVLDPDAIPDGLDDSKRLTAHRRERLFELIMARAVVAVATSGAATIDRINIRAATLSAMTRALRGLAPSPDHALIDGRDIPPDLDLAATALVGGDGRSLSIAAASVVAKVMRDRLMERCAEHYPDYGLAAHKGYGTLAHRTALMRLGPSPLHRRSFSVKSA